MPRRAPFGAQTMIGAAPSNPVPARMQRGEVMVGTWMHLARVPEVLQILKVAGADFARIDMEHAPLSIESVADAALLARAIEMPLFVRVPVADRQWITRVLDAGVWNVICPRVANAAHAREIVEAARFAPAGRRGVAGPDRPWGQRTDLTEQQRREIANREVFVTAMIETASALAEADEIASTDGIDALTVGAADVAQDLGVAGTGDESATIDSAAERVRSAARRHGKAYAVAVRDLAAGARAVAQGARIVNVSSDVDMLRNAVATALADLRARITDAAVSPP